MRVVWRETGVCQLLGYPSLAGAGAKCRVKMRRYEGGSMAAFACYFFLAKPQRKTLLSRSTTHAPSSEHDFEDETIYRMQHHPVPHLEHDFKD